MSSSEPVAGTAAVQVNEPSAATTASEEVAASRASATAELAESDDEEAEMASLSKRLLASGDFNTASVIAFLVFILIYFPCIATIAAIASEAGWKWALTSVVYNTAVAWLVSWVVYHLINWL